MPAILLYLAISIVVSILVSVLTPVPEIPGAKKPNYSDFDLITTSKDRVIPEAFGNCRCYGNLVKFDGYKSVAIKSDGNTVGYAMYANIHLVLCKVADGITKAYLGDKKSANLTTSLNSHAVQYSSQEVEFLSGYHSTQYSSQSGRSTCNFDSGYFGVNDIEVETGGNIYNLKHKVCSMKGNSIFLGDNVQSLQNYNFVVQRWKLFTTEEHSNDNNVIPPSYSYDVVSKNVNPAHLINYILKEYLNEELDFSNNVDKKLFDENFFIGFQMTTDKNVEDWIKEILRHIDGVITKDIDSGKFVIKLIRGDYLDENNDELYYIKTYDEKNYSKINFKRKTWEDVKTKINLKFTSDKNLKENVLTFNNEAAVLRNDKENVGTYEFFMVQDYKLAKIILDRVIKKECYPFIQCTIRLSMEEFKTANDTTLTPLGVGQKNLEIGGVIKISNKEMGFVDTYFRISDIKAGKEDEEYFELFLVEDIFNIEDLDYTEIQDSTVEEVETYIDDIEDNINQRNIIKTPKDLKSRNDNSIIPMINFKDDDDVLSSLIFSVMKDGFNGDEIYKTKTDEENLFYYVKIDFNNTGSDLYSSNDIKTIYFKTNFFDTKVKMFEGTEEEMQKNKFIFISNTYGMMSFKRIYEDSPGIYKMEGFIKGIYGSDEIFIDGSGSVEGYVLEVKDYFNFNLDASLFITTGGGLNSSGFIYDRNNNVQMSKSNQFNISNKAIYDLNNIYGGNDFTDPQILEYENFNNDTGNEIITMDLIRENVYNEGPGTRNIDNIVAGENEGKLEYGEFFIIEMYDFIYNLGNSFEKSISKTETSSNVDFSYYLPVGQTPTDLRIRITSYISSKNVKNNYDISNIEYKNLFDSKRIYGMDFDFIESNVLEFDV